MDKRKTEQVKQSILDSIDILVTKRISQMNTTKSLVGIVVENPQGFDVKVKINEDVHTCLLGEHLHHWIQKDDVVVVQDLYNDRQHLTVIEKTGNISPDAQLVFEDNRAPGNHISGVDGVFDEEDNLLNYATVDPSGYGPQPPREDEYIPPPVYVPDEVIYNITEPITSYMVANTTKKRYPYVIIVDDEDNLVLADAIKYVSNTQIDVRFRNHFTGKIILN